MTLPYRFTVDDGDGSLFVRWTIIVDGDVFTLFAESFRDGVSVLGRPTWTLDGQIVEGRAARLVDYNPGPYIESEARECAAWCVSQIRARGAEFAERRQVVLPLTEVKP